MNRILVASGAVVLVLAGCRHKDSAPALAHSASVATPLSSSPVLPAVDSAFRGVGAFEGQVNLVAKGKFAPAGSELPLVLQIKGGKVRIDVPQSLTNGRGLGPAYLLVQPEDKKAYAVLETQKQAVLLEFDKLAEQAQAFGAGRQNAGGNGSRPDRAPSLVKTGKFDTVAGIKCEIWRYSQGSNNAGNACIADQAEPWFPVPSGAEHLPVEAAWLGAVADGKHLPLRFVSLEHDTEQGRVEVRSVERKSLPASAFELPKDYAVVSLEQMLGSLLGGLGSGTMPPGLKLPTGIKSPPRGKLPPGASRTSK